MAPLVSVHDVSKVYRIYKDSKQRFRDALGLAATYKEFAALDGVSLSVLQGRFIGIVGRNGSGKSTLLKLIAGQLSPTSGEVVSHVHPTLLQLGLGFDKELTGIENVRQSRLMQNLELDADEIVRFVEEFSELGEFIHYPVRTYSTGMYSRLAFATAVAGDPQLLIADEVLSVGDMAFAQKCLIKMRELKERGKSVILVTHDYSTVVAFCEEAVWLEAGRVMMAGQAAPVAEAYRDFVIYGKKARVSGSVEGAVTVIRPEGQEGGAHVDSVLAKPTISRSTWTEPKRGAAPGPASRVEIVGYRFLDWERAAPVTEWIPGRVTQFELLLAAREDAEVSAFGLTLSDRYGSTALHIDSRKAGAPPIAVPASRRVIARCRFDVPSLASSDYSVSVACSDHADGAWTREYRFDSVIGVRYPAGSRTERQGGYVAVPDFSFEYRRHA
jgi:ABC-type polysaccharide/polyol phosphate transport system ATPase subunit